VRYYHSRLGLGLKLAGSRKTSEIDEREFYFDSDGIAIPSLAARIVAGNWKVAGRRVQVMLVLWLEYSRLPLVSRTPLGKVFAKRSDLIGYSDNLSQALQQHKKDVQHSHADTEQDSTSGALRSFLAMHHLPRRCGRAATVHRLIGWLKSQAIDHNARQNRPLR
jgi:hypothetical protein